MPSKDDKPVKKYTWVPKVGKNVSNKFGRKNSMYAAGYHTGTDIAAKEGAKIVWAKPNDGKVIKSGYSKDYGNYVIVKDRNVKPNATLAGEAPANNDSAKNLGPGQTLFAHMKNRGPRVGEKLSQGEMFGRVGNTGKSTGSHLHIEQTAPGDKWKYGNVVRPQLVYAANNGAAIMNRFNYVMGTTGTDGLQQTINNFRNSGNAVRTYGKPGSSSFRIEIRVGKDWVKNPNVVFDKLRAYAPVAPTPPPNNQLPPPPTAIADPAVIPPPVTTVVDGTTPPASDPTGATTPTDPGATGTTPTDPGTGDGTTPDDSVDPTLNDGSVGDEATDSTETDSLETGGSTGEAPSTTDTTDNSGATDKSTLDTKRKGATASKADLIRQKRIDSGANDVDLTKAAIKSQSLLVADRNNDQNVSKQEQKVFNPADSNNNGTVNAKELKKYIATVDLNKDNKVKPVEAKAFRTLDSNDNNNISKKELKTYRAIAGKDGNASRQEAKQILKAQIDSKQGQREHDMAKELLRRTNEKQGGSNLVGEQTRALAVTETAKRKNNDNDGPGKKKKKNS